MILRGYNIELIRLKEEDIELVRLWRNSQEVNQHMEFRATINSEMQREWFQSIDNIHNNYFIIAVKGEKIGLINGSDIDWEKRETKNGGIFIWQSEYLKTSVPLYASLLLTDISIFLGLERTYAKILKDNKGAISYNQSLGYELIPHQEAIYNQQYLLTKENYLLKTARLKSTIFKNKTQLIELIIDDPGHPVSQFYVDKVNNLPNEERKKFKIIFDHE